jgi:hypothetical protein
MSLHVFRDILDKQLTDKFDCKMGRVDGLVGRIRDGAPPIVDGIELGMTRLAERSHSGLGRWIESASRKLGVRRTPRYLVEWRKVQSVDDRAIRLTVDSESEASSDWEWWLRTHIVKKIPGGKPDDEEK